jgi:hypothetical protein
MAVVAAACALACGRRSSVVTLLALGIGVGASSAAWHVRALREGAVPRLAARRADVEVIARLVRDPDTITTSTGAALTLTDATDLGAGRRPARPTRRS